MAYSVGIARFYGSMPFKHMSNNNLGGLLLNQFVINTIDVNKTAIVASPAQQPFRIWKEESKNF